MSGHMIPPEALFLKDPVNWVAQPGCECSAAGVGFVHEVHKGPEVYAASAGSIPGLTPEETAILAGVLTGLAIFLFLLIPILCCLCPLSGCCGAGKKKAAAAAGAHRHGNMLRSEHESFWNGGSFGKGDKMDYENLYGVDMKLPRPWVDNSMNGSHFDKQDGAWEGMDMSRDEMDAALRTGNDRMGGEELAEQTGIVTYASGEAMAGGSGAGGAAYSTMDRGRSGGDEVITEYTTTRRVDMTIGGMSPEEAEGYYAQNFGGHNNDMSKDNFMKIYYQYRDGLNRSGN